jgi:hypothetical protein
MGKRFREFLVVLAGLSVLFVPAAVSAASNSNLTQTINAGSLSTDILDGSRNPVSSPSAAMGATNYSFNCQTTTGTLGSSTQRLYVTDPAATANGWTLAMAATGGATTTWSDGGTNSYKFNDATGSGCTNGQLTVDPSGGTVTADCSSSACTGSTINKGSSTAMTAANPVTLMTGAANANDYRGYLTGVGLSQKIPAEQAVANYSINMTLTVTAN